MAKYTRLSLLFLPLLLIVLFQNCSDYKALKRNINGEPYEGYSEPLTPPDEGPPPGDGSPSEEDPERVPVTDVHPDDKAEAEYSMTCTGSEEIPSLDVVLVADTYYLLFSYMDSGKLNQNAYFWSTEIFESSSKVNWHLGGKINISSLSFSGTEVYITTANGVLSLTCSSEQP